VEGGDADIVTAVALNMEEQVLQIELNAEVESFVWWNEG